MEENKLTEETFDKISHEFLYDVSKDAVIAYLYGNHGHVINDLNDLTDEMINVLWVNRLHLYLYARENGFHNKPVAKFSPDEEELPVKTKTTGTVDDPVIEAWKAIFRGFNYLDSRAKMYFLFKGCDDDTYFYFDNRRYCALAEVHVDEMSPAPDFNSYVFRDEKTFCYPDPYKGTGFFYYYDKRLKRYRFFLPTGESIEAHGVVKL